MRPVPHVGRIARSPKLPTEAALSSLLTALARMIKDGLYETVEGKLDVLRVECINAIKISAVSQKPTEL